MMTENSDPWNSSLVLSLDGGGIRGLSSLQLLRRVMERVQEIEKENAPMNAPSQILQNGSVNHGESGPSDTINHAKSAVGTFNQSSDSTLPRPCNYFDFMIGTSTGGLIAIMLGRLRMSVEECWSQYLDLIDDVFGHPRLFRLPVKYEATRLEKAIRSVIKRYCRDRHRNGSCRGVCVFRQADSVYPNERNVRTRLKQEINVRCKVAVVSFKRGVKEYNGHVNVRKPDTPYLFRSFDQPECHWTDFPAQLNPGKASEVCIWQAARATSAAPLYFKNILIEGSEHMDGGVGHNNPTDIAFNVARQMNEEGDVGVILSIGTGRKRQQSRFGSSRFGSSFGGIPALLGHMRSAVTDTDRVHGHVRDRARDVKTPYFRLDVDEGLQDMKLDEWKKTRLARRENSGWDHDDTVETSGESFLGRVTLRTIIQETDNYLNSDDARGAVEDCARILVEYARRRRQTDVRRWHDYTADSWPPMSRTVTE